MSREELIARLTKARQDFQAALAKLEQATERVRNVNALLDAGESGIELAPEALARWRRSQNSRRESIVRLTEADRALSDSIDRLKSLAGTPWDF